MQTPYATPNDGRIYAYNILIEEPTVCKQGVIRRGRGKQTGYRWSLDAQIDWCQFVSNVSDWHESRISKHIQFIRWQD